LLGAGVNGYHLKDQPLNDLKLAVQRVLEGERWISSPLISKLVNPSSTVETASPLTARQRDLLRLLQEGHDNQSIANLMNLSVKTVENHLTRLYRQLNVQSRLEAVNYALRYPHVLGILGKEAATSEENVNNVETKSFVSVLVVDDNARYRGQLQRMIGRLCPRAAIYEAENIQTAIRITQQVKPQLALIDVVLNDEDGISCTRRVKAACPQTHIILISAYPDREFHRLGLQAGAVAFLDKKDLDLQTLRLVINDVID
jgi:DNA-binding NarL/FixJ family response regulator